MKASIVDLRYKMNDVLKALDRNEEITILYRGKVKGRMLPVSEKKTLSVVEHPFFGMHRDAKLTVNEEMERLRGGRYRDI